LLLVEVLVAQLVVTMVLAVEVREAFSLQALVVLQLSPAQ
jgi:hypothetical protein